MAFPDPDPRPSALALGATSLLAIALMAIHPTHGDTPRNAIVHGRLMPVLLVQLAAYAGLGGRLGRDRVRVRSALGVFGAVVALGLVAPFAHGLDHLHLHGMMAVAPGAALWGLAAAVWMVRGAPLRRYGGPAS